MRRTVVGFQQGFFLHVDIGAVSAILRQILRIPMPAQASSNRRRTVLALASLTTGSSFFSSHSSQQGSRFSRTASPAAAVAFRASQLALMRSACFLFSALPS